MQARWFSDGMVDSLLNFDLTYHMMQQVLACHSQRQFNQPSKTYIRPSGRDREYEGGRFLFMPAYLGDPFNVVGFKSIAGVPANVGRGLPRASGVLGLHAQETGQPLAIMACGVLSARRTAGVAAITFDLLAPSGPRDVAIYGAGPISQSVVQHLSHDASRDIREFRLYDPNFERADSLRQALDTPGRPPIRLCDNPRTCAEGAGVIITCTTLAKGYLERSWVNSGALLIPLSLVDCTDELILAADKLIVDDLKQCMLDDKPLPRLIRAHKLHRNDIYAQLGDIVTGKRPGREGNEKLIYANLMGMAIEDVGLGWAVYQQGLTRSVGEVLPE